MFVKSAVREIMAKKGIGTNALAKMLGKLPQNVSDRLNPAKCTNLSIDKLDELVSALGYKIVLMPKEVNVRDGWYEIEDSRKLKATDGDADGE